MNIGYHKIFVLSKIFVFRRRVRLLSNSNFAGNFRVRRSFTLPFSLQPSQPLQCLWNRLVLSCCFRPIGIATRSIRRSNYCGHWLAIGYGSEGVTFGTAPALFEKRKDWLVAGHDPVGFVRFVRRKSYQPCSVAPTTSRANASKSATL